MSTSNKGFTVDAKPYTVLTPYMVALTFPTLVFFVQLSLKFVLDKLER